MTSILTPEIPTETALAGVLALVVAEREERHGADRRRSEAILAGAGFTIGEIAAVTQTDESQLARTLEQATTTIRPAWSRSVIDDARAHLTK